MRKIPILDLKKQIAPIRRQIDRAISRVIDSRSFILGQEVARFEKEAQEYCRVKYALGVSNGTDSIKLALVALGIQPGDRVICPAFTYYASAGAITSAGAVPEFADIEPLTYNISPESVEKILKHDRRKKIKAILPVHLYGQCADMSRILKLAASYGLKVIEDAAQAFGAKYGNKKAGTMGDCGSISFFPGKNLGAFGDAGMVITGKAAVAERIRILRDQGNRDKYYHIMPGYNHRMDSIQAAVLRVKLRHLDAWNRKRQKNAAYFNRKLSGLALKTPFVAPGNTHIYHQYVLRLKGDAAGLRRHLISKGIDCRVYYPLPLHLQQCFKHLGYKKGDFPESERASGQTLAIPVYPDLTKGQMDYIIGGIREFLR